jgi:hypothetical protein
MKYLEEYIKEKLKIAILGELTTDGSTEGDNVGVSLIIDGYEPGIEVWYIDYANWLEEKMEALEKRLEVVDKLNNSIDDKNYYIKMLEHKVKTFENSMESEMKLEDFLSESTSTQENKIDNSEKFIIEFKDFKEEVMEAMKNKPEQWRDGQFVFNYINEKYGVARHIQYITGVDCFYDNNKIDEFIRHSYDALKEFYN